MANTDLVFKIFFFLQASMKRKSALELAQHFGANKQAVQRALNFLCDYCEDTLGVIKKAQAPGRLP